MRTSGKLSSTQFKPGHEVRDPWRDLGCRPNQTGGKVFPVACFAFRGAARSGRSTALRGDRPE
jgi:hypothetical protein